MPKALDVPWLACQPPSTCSPPAGLTRRRIAAISVCDAHLHSWERLAHRAGPPLAPAAAPRAENCGSKSACTPINLHH